MGWSTSAPSSSEYTFSGMSTSAHNTQNNNYEFWCRTAIARGYNNHIAVKVEFWIRSYNYNASLYPTVKISLYPSVQIAGKSYTGSANSYGCSKQWETSNVATYYYTGTADNSCTIVADVMAGNTNTGGITYSKIAYKSSYNIIYNANSGSGSMANTPCAYGSWASISGNGFSRNGYSFTNWNTASNGSGTSYTPGQSVTLSSNLTLYAQWTENPYSIIYKANGSGETDVSQAKSYGVDVEIKAADTFTYEGYTFQNWNTSDDDTGTSYDPGDTYSANADLTLYAIWKKNNIPLFVSVDGNIKQVAKAYTSVNGTIKECVVYTSVDGTIKELS